MMMAMIEFFPANASSGLRQRRAGRLQKAALRALATTLPPEELTALRDQFAAIDADGSGAVSFAELRAALRARWQGRGFFAGRGGACAARQQPAEEEAEKAGVLHDGQQQHHHNY